MCPGGCTGPVFQDIIGPILTHFGGLELPQPTVIPVVIPFPRCSRGPPGDFLGKMRPGLRTDRNCDVPNAFQTYRDIPSIPKSPKYSSWFCYDFWMFLDYSQKIVDRKGKKTHWTYLSPRIVFCPRLAQVVLEIMPANLPHQPDRSAKKSSAYHVSRKKDPTKKTVLNIYTYIYIHTYIYIYIHIYIYDQYFFGIPQAPNPHLSVDLCAELIGACLGADGALGPPGVSTSNVVSLGGGHWNKTSKAFQNYEDIHYLYIERERDIDIDIDI